MKKKWIAIFLCILFLPVSSGIAAQKKPVYSLSGKGCTVLQNINDRKIDVAYDAAAHALIPGESPVTGQSLNGRYFPMLVSISNTLGNVEVKGRTIKAAGVGKRASWGLQNADIVYEEAIISTGYTRFAVLFSDCFTSDKPSLWLGPVRSCRAGALILREEWQSGLVYGGGFAGSFTARDPVTTQLLEKTDADEKGLLISTLVNRYLPYRHRVMKKKAPDNLSVDLVALRNTIPDTYAPAPHPYLFKEGLLYTDGYPKAGVIHLDWGEKYTISHFVYDETQNQYLRYCGAGKKANKWAPFISFENEEETDLSKGQPLAFANLIVERVSYEYQEESSMKPVVQSVGKGNADIFMDGHYIAGYWARPSLSDHTVFYDDQGKELQLNRGKTFIALFPTESLLLYAEE